MNQIHNKITGLTTEIGEVARRQAESQKSTEDMLQCIISTQTATPSFTAELDSLRADVNESKATVVQIQKFLQEYCDETIGVTTEMIGEVAGREAANQKSTEGMLQHILLSHATAPSSPADLDDLRVEIHKSRDTVNQIQNEFVEHRDEITRMIAEIQEGRKQAGCKSENNRGYTSTDHIEPVSCRSGMYLDTRILIFFLEGRFFRPQAARVVSWVNASWYKEFQPCIS